jgi:hypothetical protein
MPPPPSNLVLRNRLTMVHLGGRGGGGTMPRRHRSKTMGVALEAVGRRSTRRQRLGRVRTRVRPRHQGGGLGGGSPAPWAMAHWGREDLPARRALEGEGLEAGEGGEVSGEDLEEGGEVMVEEGEVLVGAVNFKDKDLEGGQQQL